MKEEEDVDEGEGIEGEGGNGEGVGERRNSRTSYFTLRPLIFYVFLLPGEGPCQAYFKATFC